MQNNNNQNPPLVNSLVNEKLQHHLFEQDLLRFYNDVHLNECSLTNLCNYLLRNYLKINNPCEINTIHQNSRVDIAFSFSYYAVQYTFFNPSSLFLLLIKTTIFFYQKNHYAYEKCLNLLDLFIPQKGLIIQPCKMIMQVSTNQNLQPTHLFTIETTLSPLQFNNLCLQSNKKVVLLFSDRYDEIKTGCQPIIATIYRNDTNPETTKDALIWLEKNKKQMYTAFSNFISGLDRRIL